MELTREELGRRIRSARETCGLTQEQLGDSAGLTRVAVGQIEAGARSVSSLELDRLAHAVAATSSLSSQNRSSNATLYLLYFGPMKRLPSKRSS